MIRLQVNACKWVSEVKSTWVKMYQLQGIFFVYKWISEWVKWRALAWGIFSLATILSQKRRNCFSTCQYKEIWDSWILQNNKRIVFLIYISHVYHWVILTSTKQWILQVQLIFSFWGLQYILQLWLQIRFLNSHSVGTYADI